MALDTREKRENVPGVGRPWLRAHHTETIDEQWRIGVGLAYGGNALSAAANDAIEQARSVARFVFSRVFGRVN